MVGSVRNNLQPLLIFAGLCLPIRQKSVDRFKDQIRSLTRRNAPVRLRDVIEAINPVIRGWGNYYRKAHVRKLFHRMDGWIERLHRGTAQPS